MNRKYCKCIKIKSIHTTGRNCGISVIHTHRQLQICNVLYKSNRPHCNTNGRATSDSQNNYLKNFHKIHYEHLICFTFYWPCIMQWSLVNDQRDTQIPFYVFIFLFITLYTFRAHRAHHQERKIVSIQPLGTVILCWWPRCIFFQPAHLSATNIEWILSEVVLIQFASPDDEHDVLETCRDL